MKPVHKNATYKCCNAAESIRMYVPDVIVMDAITAEHIKIPNAGYSLDLFVLLVLISFK